MQERIDTDALGPLYGEAARDTEAAVGPFATPWARLWSRYLDLALWQLIIGGLLNIAFPGFVSLPVFSGSNGGHLLTLLTLPPVMALDAVVLGLWGNTPGRLMAGIKVEMLDHSKPSLAVCLNRNSQIYIYGLLLGIPIATLAGLGNAYRKLDKHEFVRWDAALSTRVYNHGANIWRTSITAAVYFVLAVVPAVLLGLAKLKAS